MYLSEINNRRGSIQQIMDSSKKSFIGVGIKTSVLLNAILEQQIKLNSNDYKYISEKQKVIIHQRQDYDLLNIKGLEIINNKQTMNSKKQITITPKQQKKNIYNQKKIQKLWIPESINNSFGYHFNNFSNRLYTPKINESKHKNRRLSNNMTLETSMNSNMKSEFITTELNESNSKKLQNISSQNIKFNSYRNQQSINDKRRSISYFDQNNKKQLNQIQKILSIKQFNFVINLSNQIHINNLYQQSYKAYICKGNNGNIIKTLLKSRPWWSLVNINEIQTCNLIWTEWKKPRLFDLLKTTIKQKRFKTHISPLKINTDSIEKKRKIYNIEKLIYLQKYPHLKQQIKEHPSIYFTFSEKLNYTNIHLFENLIIHKQFLLNVENAQNIKILNHLEGGLHLHSKKLLFHNLSRYYKKNKMDVFSILPLTYVIKNLQDEQFMNFSRKFESIQQSVQKPESKKSCNTWICKPGENSNRGKGIFVLNNFNAIKSIINHRAGTNKTTIVQKYIENPFLYHKRKFDLRCYLLITSVNGIIKGYWYDEGYIRTSSKQFTLKNIENRMIHLTNDAIQKLGDQYGKFQGNNKVSFQDFQKYLQNNSYKYKLSNVFNKMKKMTQHLMKSIVNKIDSKRKQFTFQLFGLDFMLDEHFKPYLIEANSNPCLQVQGPVLGKIIPRMIENVIKIAIDPLFPPPLLMNSKIKKYFPLNNFENNKFELIYDELFEPVFQQKDEFNDAYDLEKQLLEQYQLRDQIQ